jgi:Transposase IS116/IS110/IS902 family
MTEPGAHVRDDGRENTEPEPGAHATDDSPSSSEPEARLKCKHDYQDDGEMSLRCVACGARTNLYRLTYRLIEDLQRVRLAHGNRIRQMVPHLERGNVTPPRGVPTWEVFFKASAEVLEQEEARVLTLAKSLLRRHDLGRWLLGQKGIGPALGCSILGECWPLDRFQSPRRLWAFAGLHVGEDGKAVRRKKGQKANWNSRLKTRLWLFGGSVLKAGGPWRELYDTRKVLEQAKAGLQNQDARQAPGEADPAHSTAAGQGADAQVGPPTQADSQRTDDADRVQRTAASQTRHEPVGAQTRADSQRANEPDAAEPAGAQSASESLPSPAPSRLLVHNRALRVVEKALLKDLWRVAHGQEPLVGPRP